MDGTPGPARLASPRTARSVAGRLRALVALTGGGTVERGSGRCIGEGIAVAAEPWAARDLALADWDDRLVARWVVALAPVLGRRDAHLGAWLDPCSGRVWIEPVWVLPAGALDLARAIGRAHGQRAVYDLGRHRLVPLANGAPFPCAVGGGAERA